jgi:subtilisin
VAKPDLNDVILLPAQGLRVGANDNSSCATFFRNLKNMCGTVGDAARPQPKLEFDLSVVDQIYDGGASLCQIDMTQAAALRAKYPGVRIVPVSYCDTAVKRRPHVTGRSSAATRMVIQVVSAFDGRPLPHAKVSAYIDFDKGTGERRTTNSKGEVHLSLHRARTLERLYVDPRANYWSSFETNVPVHKIRVVRLTPLDLRFTDCLRYFYGNAPLEAGNGVKVAIVDSGIEEHEDLRIDGGVNTVPGENPNAIGDSGLQHGTHVAGIVAARGTPPHGVRGLAPGVTLRSYRVFAKGKRTASNYAIAKAIDRAVDDGCHLINISLSGAHSVVLDEAVAYAHSKGTLVLAAAGNDDHDAVSFPAADSLAFAVSAMGRKKTFPRMSSHREDIARPFGTDRMNFLAAFSNVGFQLDLTAPGVGIISTVPDGYVAMDGTSMACPAVTGAAARLLSENPKVLHLPRTQSRTDAMANLIFASTIPMGFGGQNEGRGLIHLRRHASHSPHRQ